MRKYRFLLCLAAFILTGCSDAENSTVPEPSKPAIESNLSSDASVSSSPVSAASFEASALSISESAPVNIEKPKVGDMMGPEDMPLREKAFCISTNTAHNKDGSVMSTYYTVFDDHDNMIAIIDERKYYYAYEYDKDGNIAKKYESVTNSVTEYEYNDDGLVTKMRYTNSDGGTLDELYEYDEHGTLIKTTHYTAVLDTTTVNETKPEYDAQGRLVRKTEYLSNGSASSVEEYEYNDKGEIVRETGSSSGAKTVSEYTYDERGNVLSEHEKRVNDADGAVTYETRTEYEYNSDNKQTSEKSFNIENGAETPGRYITSSYEY